ncbi:PREDICTED: 5-hydroxytryptamine receptor 5B-like [Rhagoletis zephyria]|uniref:5-hydroxytryptamine receptor 5B-like n=1 Tax=Rhagoletis zephyria TaxID=28612 RepID=UPI0008117911|nr:PREDICTED: 5-hydroxytryptamine receptor 5B-like [Rhagoletis zephyria]
MDNTTLFSSSIKPSNCQFLQLISGLFFLLLICCTVFGNLLVIIAIIRFRHLRRTSNYLICSLALTDLIVGLILMPLKAFNEVVNLGSWRYGRRLCFSWLFLAILCSTASSFHLLAIAVDRYLAINRPHSVLTRRHQNTQKSGSLHWGSRRHKFQVAAMVVFSWAVSFGIALFPLTVWIDEAAFEKGLREQICFPAQKVIHKLASQVVVFYGPIAIMIPLYVKIYQKSKRQCCPLPSPHLLAALPPTKAENKQQQQRTTTKTSTSSSTSSTDQKVQPALPPSQSQPKPNYHRYRREYRVAKTLLTVLLAYIIFLWPFYLTTLITSTLGERAPPRLLYSLALWFLYSNSMVNPLIYAALNRHFARAFKQLLHI